MMKSIKRLGTLVTVAGAALTLGLATSTAAFAAETDINLSYSTPNFGCGAGWSSSTVHLVFQCDGNLVLYRTSDGHAMWATGTYGQSLTPDTLDFSHNGDIELLAGGAVVCSVHTPGNLAPNGHAAVQEDGNFVIYNQAGTAVWASNTYNNQQGTVHECA